MDLFDTLSSSLPIERLRVNEGLDRHSTYKVGGPADVMCWPKTVQELSGIVSVATKHEIPWIVLGNGSNTLFLDEGFRGIVIKIRGSAPVKGTLWHLEQDNEYIRAGAGISLPRLARSVANFGLSGLEFCTGIPGALGGSIRGNAGAHGSDLGGLLKSIELLMSSGEIVIMPAYDAEFSYRNSSIDSSSIITSALFKLKPDQPENVYERIRSFAEYRQQTQPSSEQSAGCMFKNPKDDKAGRLIDVADCKGLQVGGAKVSNVHANFVINHGGATAADALRLIDVVRERVLERTGVTLELEVRVIKPGIE